MISEQLHEALLTEGGNLDREHMMKVLARLPGFHSVKDRRHGLGDKRDMSIVVRVKATRSRKRDETISDQVNAWARKRGWYVQSHRRPDAFDTDVKGKDWIAITLNPSKPAQGKAFRKYLYHMTDTANLASIKKRGLIPSKAKAHLVKGRRYDPRVFLFSKKSSLDSMLHQNDAVHAGADVMFPAMTKTDNVSVLVIDPSKLRQGTKLYKDPEFALSGGEAVWTPTHIPPEAIVRSYKHKSTVPEWFRKGERRPKWGRELRAG